MVLPLSMNDYSRLLRFFTNGGFLVQDGAHAAAGSGSKAMRCDVVIGQ